jgi:hypothetical protein
MLTKIFRLIPPTVLKLIDGNQNEIARAIMLTSEQWFLLSGTETTDGGLIITSMNEIQKTPGLYQSKETSTIYFFKQLTYVLPFVCRSG